MLPMASNATNTNPKPHVGELRGELYRDENGHEVWRIKEIQTGNILRDGIASDNDYRWLLDALNHGDDYADEQQAARESSDWSLGKPSASRSCSAR